MKLKITALLLLTLLNVSGIDWHFDAGQPWTTNDMEGFTYSYQQEVDSCTVILGEFSSGWWDTIADTQTTGFWDLGSSGTVIATLQQADIISVTTVEWIDWWIFSNFSEVSIPGFTAVSSTSSEIEPSPIFFGGWWTRTIVFQGSRLTQTSLTLTGQARGTLLNELMVTFENQAQVKRKLSRSRVYQ